MVPLEQKGHPGPIELRLQFPVFHGPTASSFRSRPGPSPHADPATIRLDEYRASISHQLPLVDGPCDQLGCGQRIVMPRMVIRVTKSTRAW